MYSLAQVRRGVARGVRSPAYFGRECNRLYHTRLHTRDWYTDGVDVVAADWDTLVLLDGCRYDTFADRADLPGQLEPRRSRGAHTVEFLRGNFRNRDLRDTVYVTASPQFHRRREALGTRFHDVIDVWREEGWDDEHGTVLPETTTEAALEAGQTYPSKRLVVHYLQPHYPFIDAGEFGPGFGDEVDEWRDVWQQLFEGDDVDPNAVRAAYRANLDRALPAVRRLLDQQDGLTVVTADHGNMLGERAFPVPIHEWGHPRGVYTDELLRVPWLSHSQGPRPDIVAGDAAPSTETDSDAVERRLRDLGYME